MEVTLLVLFFYWVNERISFIFLTVTQLYNFTSIDCKVRWMFNMYCVENCVHILSKLLQLD